MEIVLLLAHINNNRKIAFSNVNKWYGKWNALFDKWQVTPYEVNVACKENEGQLSYHASYSKGEPTETGDTHRDQIFCVYCLKKKGFTDSFLNIDACESFRKTPRFYENSIFTFCIIKMLILINQTD